jgi:hypothetical protein
VTDEVATVRIEVGARRTGVTNPETQIATWFATYDAPIAMVGKALRAKLRARLPGLKELVYVYERQESPACTPDGSRRCGRGRRRRHRTA